MRHNFDPINESSRLYSPKMVEVMGARTGVDVLAQLHAGLSYKCYSLKHFNKIFAGDKFEYDRKIEWFQKIRHASVGEEACPMFKWSNNPLEHYLIDFEDIKLQSRGGGLTVIITGPQNDVQTVTPLLSDIIKNTG